MLSDKASKHSIYAVENRINESFKPTVQDLQKQILTNVNNIEE